VASGAPADDRRSVRARRLIALSCACGVAFRLGEGWHWLNAPNAEADNVARALAAGRGFADAFFIGGGPTAHLMPPTPLLAAGIYALFGSGTTGETVLLLLGVATVIACFLLAARVAWLLGTSRGAAAGGLAFLLLAPIHDFTEAVRWRCWDGGVATLLLLAMLVLLLEAERGRRAHGFELARAAVPALALLVNPITGVAASVIALAFIWRDRARVAMLRPILLLAAATAILFAPWVARNARALDHPVLTRDNLGLELAMAYYPAAVAPTDPLGGMQQRQAAIHPLLSAPARARLRALGGELAYSRALQAETLRWMSGHPVAVARIWMRHLSEMLFPRPWMFRAEHEKHFAVARAVAAALVTALALIELAIMAGGRDPLALYPLIAIGSVTLLTSAFQPVMRYCWILYPLLAMLAARAVWRGVEGLARRRDQAARRAGSAISV